VIILDTDIISVLDSRSGSAYENLAARLARRDVDHIAITIVSFEEQMRGWLSYIAASRALSRQIEGYARLHRLLRWYQEQELLDFNTSAADVYEKLKRARVRLGAMDLKIAAIALDRGALLVSRNLRDFRKVPNLQVEDWSAK
jgi:tRNA(fMet)-specific endonuclease VapC